MTLNSASNLNQFQYTISGIDGLTVAVTPLFTTLAGAGNFFVSDITVILENVAGVPTLGSFISLGYNNPTYDNVDSGDFFNAINVNQYILANGQPGLPFTPIPPSTTVSINVQIPEAGATTYDLKVLIFGNYI